MENLFLFLLIVSNKFLTYNYLVYLDGVIIYYQGASYENNFYYWEIYKLTFNTITTNIYLGLFVPREVKWAL